MNKWNQITIHRWAIETFGPVSLNTTAVAIRMCKESVELADLLYTDDGDEDNATLVRGESADVSIVLVQVARCLGFELDTTWEPEFKAIFKLVDEALVDLPTTAHFLSHHSIELISAIQNGKTEFAKTQIVSLLAVLSVIEEIFEFKMNEAIHEKMEINAARSWEQASDGSFQHA